MKVVILAGGGGTRLWPVSRKSKPKQIQPFIGNQTLMQLTYRRLRQGVAARDIYISTNYDQAPLIRRQLSAVPRRNYILETAKRDTASAIGLAAVRLAKDDPQAVMVMANSDHYIQDVPEYFRTLRLAERILTKHPEYSLLLGIKPLYPETGYGYIKINKVFHQYGNDEVFYGQKFVEKPDRKTAERYVKSWDYLWNSGIFCWQADHLLSLYKKHLPAHYRLLMQMQPALGTSREKAVVTRLYKKLPAISIDYGIMEKVKKLLVIPVSFDWADVGHWRTVKDILSKRPDDTITKGIHIGVDSSNNLIYSYTGRVVGTAGLHDMIIIDTDDALLVCPRDHAQDVKKIVEQLAKKKLKKYL